jgi:hypothetical protein
MVGFELLPHADEGKVAQAVPQQRFGGGSADGSIVDFHRRRRMSSTGKVPRVYRYDRRNAPPMAKALDGVESADNSVDAMQVAYLVRGTYPFALSDAAHIPVGPFRSVSHYAGNPAYAGRRRARQRNSDCEPLLCVFLHVEMNYTRIHAPLSSRSGVRQLAQKKSVRCAEKEVYCPGIMV